MTHYVKPAMVALCIIGAVLVSIFNHGSYLPGFLLFFGLLIAANA